MRFLVSLIHALVGVVAVAISPAIFQWFGAPFPDGMQLFLFGLVTGSSIGYIIPRETIDGCDDG
jgi:hypothetical protein